MKGSQLRKEWEMEGMERNEEGGKGEERSDKEVEGMGGEIMGRREGQW